MYFRTIISSVILVLILGLIGYTTFGEWDVKMFVIEIVAASGWALVIRYAYQTDFVNELLDEEDDDDWAEGLHVDANGYLTEQRSADIIQLDKEWFRRAGH